MPVHNSEIAAMFDMSPTCWRCRTPTRSGSAPIATAADTIRDQSRSVASMVEEGEDLSELPDIGEDLAGKIGEMVRTGNLSLLDELSEDVPEAIVEATRIPGIGPKRARALFEALDLGSIDDLKTAAKAGRIADIEGFGEKTEARIREELEKGDITERRFRLDVAEDFAEPLVAWIREIDGVDRAEIAGSYRRRKETVGDLDILAAGEDGGAIIDRFTEYDEVEEVVSKGKTRSTVRLRSGLNVDLRVIPEASWGAGHALLHRLEGP